MKKRTVVFLILGLWLLTALAVIGFNQYTVLTGTRVLLKTVPIDPRDVLRGDYIILHYEINRLDTNKIPSDFENFAVGKKIFLILKKENIYWIPVEIRNNKPEGDEVFLTGQIIWFHNDTRNIQVVYGIENYFIPEGKGRQVEELQGQGLGVEVSIDKNGRGVIIQLYLDGEKLIIE